MADHEAIVEILMGGRAFKISGSEKFVEKMIATLPTLLTAVPHEPEHKEDGKHSKKTEQGFTQNIDDFVRKVKLTNDLPATQRVGAFVYYLTEVEKKASCSRAEIEECFDKTGLKTPGNLPTVINNATKGTKPLIRASGHGQYTVTTNGKNLVKEMVKGE